MRHGWLAGLILSFSLFLIIGPSFGESPEKGYQGLSPEDIRKMEEIVGRFQKPLPEKTYTPLVEKSQEICGPEHFGDTIEELYPDLGMKAKNGFSKMVLGPEARISKEDTWYYLFSFSMPKDSIKRAAKEAAELRGDGIPVVMVLRGFVDNSFKTTAVKVYALLKELKVDLPFEIDPELFEEAGVNSVPALTRTGQGILQGDVSLRWSMEKLQEEPGGHQKWEKWDKWGNTYEIGEEDIVKYIGRNQAMLEARTREKIEEIKGKIYALNKYRGRFPQVEKETVYLIDPTYTLQEDIRDQNGNIVFAKGIKANPADYGTLGRYVIIDGNDPKQVEFAVKGGFRKIMIVAGDIAKLTAEYRQRFYFVNDRIIDLVKLKRVPAVFEQEGSHVKVTEKKL
jgi:conjugal transfer pilus assembly protein TraW